MIRAIDESNIVALLETNAKDKDQLDAYLRNKCKLWLAIRNYIKDCDIGQCPFFDKVGIILSYRGTGAAISMKECFIKPAGAYPLANETVRFCVDIVMFNEDEDRECLEYAMIDAPLALMEHFDDLGFKKFIDDSTLRWNDRKSKAVAELMEKIKAKSPKTEAILRKILETCPDD